MGKEVVVRERRETRAVAVCGQKPLSESKCVKAVLCGQGGSIPGGDLRFLSNRVGRSQVIPCRRGLAKHHKIVCSKGLRPFLERERVLIL